MTDHADVLSHFQTRKNAPSLNAFIQSPKVKARGNQEEGQWEKRKKSNAEASDDGEGAIKEKQDLEKENQEPKKEERSPEGDGEGYTEVGGMTGAMRSSDHAGSWGSWQQYHIFKFQTWHFTKFIWSHGENYKEK